MAYKRKEDARAYGQLYREEHYDAVKNYTAVWNLKHPGLAKTRSTYAWNLKKRKWESFFRKLGKSICERCGYNKSFMAIDFHHIGKKTFGICKFTNRKRPSEENMELVREELKQCLVLCANCHRELHDAENREKEGQYAIK